MRWRDIGPTRAGRARAVSGVASQPNTFYAGFDNGGVWRSTDFGANWVPLFDRESTGSIGAIAVAPSNPRVIYVGSGAGIIRPDLSIGDGVYKSIDGGATWTHLGLRESQMIAAIAVDPGNENRLFVAVLGHPYAPNAERGVFRSMDGGRTFEKVLFKDEYTSANEVVIDPGNPNIVYATLWQQQESFIEGRAFNGAGMGIFKSTDGGTTWTQLSMGLPSTLQANIAVAPSATNVLYAVVAPGEGPIRFYKSTDGGATWYQPILGARNETPEAKQDMRPLSRIGGGDLPTLAVDPRNPDVVYSASVVMWRTENGGLTWSAVRGAPGGDDYQRIWINPNDPKIIVAVADQGAVVSANRGVSWSNWYNQNTAAMYHVTTDFSFPYRVCSGQQDSGSACVQSRSDDGRITFHDWHPVNIQEYGMAAPDPTDPDVVFGSQRSGVSRYDRRTRQTQQVGPDVSGTLPGGGAMNRNVRTMPLHFSPVDQRTLYYASNVVWKSTDKAHSWTRISPDLTRQTWAVPANAGKYASTVTPGPWGSITALSPSPRSLSTIWVGTDDGFIQVTTDGGTSWRNVTPPSIRPWTRIFNIEAGHFDNLTAYAAANTLRLDDINPHFYRTHDGGKSWTEINTGIPGGAVANSIREDPRQRGLLYAATDAQVWVSFDDGDHWQSLRNGMPAISVRDLQIKDDSTCLCADLIAGTHGRGFWILDNVTPLRQAAAARQALSSGSPYLFKPGTAVRVRFATNEPTPWPPELPAGENPPPGGLIDYYLPRDASGEVKLEVLDTKGTVVRSFSSTEPVFDPDPGKDMAAYDAVCQKNPTAAYCGLPLYWPAPQYIISTKAGMHRFSWDLRFDPVSPQDLIPAGDEEATGAVPGRTYPNYNVPWVPAGSYTVRLTVEGKTYTQPIEVKLDPRVKIAPAVLAQINALSVEMYQGAVSAHRAFNDAKALASKVASLSGTAAEALKSELESLAPTGQRRTMPGGFRRRGAPVATPSLEQVSNALQSAGMALQATEARPTAVQVGACEAARRQLAAVMARWRTAQARAAALGVGR
ncbi:MAG: glycoside hydrolase [Gemmatimonadaceae bacterium]|nr:glycoside hydrolase [Gemmatimonadaceae bacterium]